MPTAPFRVFLIDDHPIVRAGVRLAISELPGFVICGETSVPQGAAAAAKAAQADIVIADLLLGVTGDGFDLIAALREALPQARLLIFSMNAEEMFAERALRAGANGYLMKGGDLTALQHAIQVVARGEEFVSPALMRSWGTRRPGVPVNHSLSLLSDREMQVFLLLGAGKSTQQIATDLGVSMKTASTHRENIKVKLGLEGGAELVRYAVSYVVAQGRSA